MNGKIIVKIGGRDVSLWFNNYSKIELAKYLLPKEKGFDPRPEEEQLVLAINEKSKDNYLLLLKHVVNSGVKGMAYATDQPFQISSEEVSIWIAEASNEEIYSVWMVFLQAYGFDLLLNDNETEQNSEKEKKKTRSKN